MRLYYNIRKHEFNLCDVRRCPKTLFYFADNANEIFH